MDPNRFDAVIRTLGIPSTRRRALAGLVAAALAGVPGLATAAKRRRGRLRAQSHNNGGDHGGGTTRVTICHKPGTPAEQTLEIDDDALDGHLGHGDHKGPCCKPPTRFCPETGTCERCCPRCGTCQSCVEGVCQPAQDTTPCKVGDPPQDGICCNGTCRPGARTCEGCFPACSEPEVCRGDTCVCPGTGGPCPPDRHCCREGCRPLDVPCNCPGTGGPCPPDLECCPFVGCLPPDRPCPCPGTGGPCPPETHCCPEGCIPREEPCRG